MSAVICCQFLVFSQGTKNRGGGLAFSMGQRLKLDPLGGECDGQHAKYQRQNGEA
jgi:hypothetical protein